MSEIIHITDIIGEMGEIQIRAFCKRRGLERETFNQACEGGNSQAIEIVAREMQIDIQEMGTGATEFHRRALAHCLYWQMEKKKIDLVPDFYSWMVEVLFPNSKRTDLGGKARRLFVTAFSSLSQNHTGDSQNISLICRALEYALEQVRKEGGTTFSIGSDRKAVLEVLKNDEELVQFGKDYPIKAMHNLQSAMSQFSILGQMRKNDEINKNSVGDVSFGWVEGDIIFLDIFEKVVSSKAKK